jgi:hypothetical protein
MEVLMLLVAGGMNVLCFYIGAKVGNAVAKDKEIEMPTVNPFKAYQEHQERREADREKTKIETILQNIDNYDGTGSNQKDVPS